ncbi:MAG: hypothetical protein JXR60_08640 [Bacteroidales bacterium]|nr:hypothetical protein [Bacteroidales bacterium]
MAQKTKRIEILNANSIEFDEKIGKDVKRLLGNVQFQHENAIMYCDSAYLNSKTNILQAFNNVRIKQGDSLNLYGDYLNYNGNTRMARVRRNVRLVHGQSTLKTDSLDYDRNMNIGHYFDWGFIKDQQNDLKSVNGYYYSDTKDYYAVDSVTLLNPDYTIFSDSLRYNTGTDISYFYGSTDIVSDSNFIYCEFGWYDTKKDISKVAKNAYILSKDKKLSGDSLFYDRNLGYGEAKNKVALLDTSAQILITGDYAEYFERNDSAYVTLRALMTKYNQEDTLFLHADTLKLFRVIDSIKVEIYQYTDSLVYIGNDSVPQENRSDLDTSCWITQTFVSDTLFTETTDTTKIVLAFHHVQIFKDDIQARTDSLSYSTKDSTIRLFKLPIIWSGEKQITAEYIELQTENNKPTKMNLLASSFITIQDDSIRFNQIQGKDMVGFFNLDNELSKLDVYTDAKSIFFPREDATEEQQKDSLKGDLVGVNLTESTTMTIWFEENQPIKVTLYKQPNGILNPVGKLPQEELYLKGFSWKEAIRPQTKNDIFIWKEQ